MPKQTLDPDAPLRSAALATVERLVALHGPTLPWSAIDDAGFKWEGQRIYLASKACGIFRPKEMNGGALSIRTSEPRKGRQKRYEDTPLKDGAFAYKFQGNDPNNRFNRLLYEAHRLAVPLIYFLGVSPGVYRPIWPVYVRSIDEARKEYRLTKSISYSMAEERLPEAADAEAVAVIARKYATRQAKQRLHQGPFREEVLKAYNNRCAVCLLPGLKLLEAAHIVPDSEEAGVPVVQNGLALCHLHHGLLDANLMGIQPDGVIKLHPSLLDAQGGPTLEHAIKPFHHQRIHPPKRLEHQPAQEYLTLRYAHFLKSVNKR